MATRYRAVARVAKAHGNKGKVVAVPAGGLPALLREGMHVALVPPRLRGPRRAEVLSAEGDDAGQLVSLAGVGDRAASEPLVGTTLLVPVDELPDDLALRDADALVGREVVDAARGLRATISEVMRGPANDVWVLACEEPAGAEVLVPVVDGVVSEVPDSGPVPVRVPDGLI